MKRFLWLGFVLSVYLICSGCGETFRPIIIPNPPTFPNPAASHSVLSINDNGTITAGSAMVIDVSGDTDISQKNVGLVPVHAVQQTASQILVVNQSVAGPQNTGDSLTKLSFNGTSIAGSTTISLPPNSGPDFVAVAPTDSNAYVTLPNLNSVAVVNTLSSTQTYTIPAGSQPYALAVTPDKSKLYAANVGDSTISGFNTVDRSSRVGSPTAASSAPIWLTPRTDSQAVYVLEKSGLLAWLNTTSTAGPDILTETSNPQISVPGAALMVYDLNLNRLYIPGGSQIAIVDVSQSPPQYLAGGPITTCQPGQINCIPTVPASSRGSTDPCSQTSPQSLTVVAAAALPDGSRAYVGAYYVDAADNVCPQVTVIDAVSFAVGTSIPVPGFPDATNPAKPTYYVPACAPTSAPAPYRANFRFMMAAGGDSSRAYLSSCDGGMINIIDTVTESYIESMPAPIGARPPIPPSQLNPPQNPVFFFAGP